MTHELLEEKYLKINKSYFGKNVILDEPLKYEWSRIPHFYYNFYVYKYATGCCSAISCAQDILKNGPENYLNMLKKGGSDYPLNLLKSNNIDLNTKKPIENTIEKFNELVEELEELLK